MKMIVIRIFWFKDIANGSQASFAIPGRQGNAGRFLESGGNGIDGLTINLRKEPKLALQ
jgi:hypothetical protein